MSLRVIHISDTHMDHSHLKMPDGDILVHTGDFSGLSNDRELIKFNDWLGRLEGKYREIFFVPGNHDSQFENYHYAASMLTNAVVLFDRQVEFAGYKIYGSPWTTTFFDWSFMKDRNIIKAVWDMIPDDTNILLTHQPPHFILDTARDLEDNKKIVHVGCEALRETCMNRLKNLKLHCFGHLHNDGGKIVEEHGIVFSNGAILNDFYSATHQPNIIDLA